MASDYAYLADEKSDTLVITEAIMALQDGDILLLENKTYNFYPEYAIENEYYISNNDYGIKPCVFPLIGKKHITVEGNGAELIFHGKVMPFIIDACTDITVKNLSIDYSSPFFAQGQILESDEHHTVIQFDGKEFQCKVKNGNFYFYNEKDEWYDDTNQVLALEFDSKLVRPVIYNPPYFPYTGEKRDHGFLEKMFYHTTLKELGDNRIAMYGDYGFTHNVGNYLVCKHSNREFPGFFINDSDTVTLENLHIYHTAAMGIIAQFSRDIILKNIVSVIRDGSKRMATLNADAMHFVGCRGKVTIKDCKFENMLDDAFNVHGNYNYLRKRIGRNTLLVGFGDYRQRGVRLYSEGDRIGITDFKTGEKLTFTVKKAVNISKEYIRLEVNEDIPDIPIDLLVENLTAYPEVYIDGCETGNNRPQSFLLGSPRKTVVENCRLYSMSTSLNIGGAGKAWYESGFAGDVVIRNNEFYNSAYAGGYAISVRPEYVGGRIVDNCHRNIVIENNHFTLKTLHFITARSVENIVFRQNTYTKDDTLYAVPDGGRVWKTVDISDCRHVEAEEPIEIKKKIKKGVKST